jgi:hypothetical protein
VDGTPAVFPVAGIFPVAIAFPEATGGALATGSAEGAVVGADADAVADAVALGVGAVATAVCAVSDAAFPSEFPGGGSRRSRAAIAPTDPRMTSPATAPLAIRATGRLLTAAPPLRPEETGAIVPPKGGAL